MKPTPKTRPDTFVRPEIGMGTAQFLLGLSFIASAFRIWTEWVSYRFGGVRKVKTYTHPRYDWANVSCYCFIAAVVYVFAAYALQPMFGGLLNWLLR